MYLNDLFPEEFDAYLAAGSAACADPVAVIPVGSVEQHGPHLLLGCDGYISLAFAKMTAEKLGAVLCPMVPFSWIGGLRPFAGTIDMRSATTGDYLEQLMLRLFANGFGRIAVINCHGGGRELVYSVCRRVFKQTKKPVVNLYPSKIYDAWPELKDIWVQGGMAMDWSAIEAAELSGALCFLGMEDLSDKVLQDTADCLAEFGAFAYQRTTPGLREAFRMSEVGHDYDHECQHVAPRSNINRETAIRALDFMAEKVAWGVLQAK